MNTCMSLTKGLSDSLPSTSFIWTIETRHNAFRRLSLDLCLLGLAALGWPLHVGLLLGEDDLDVARGAHVCCNMNGSVTTKGGDGSNSRLMRP